MPIYEYQCSHCGYNLEKLQKFNDLPLKKCPECATDQLQRLISATGFQLKGTGWYVTDFKDQKKSKKAEVKKEDVSEDKTGKSTDPAPTKSEADQADSKVSS